MITSTGALTDRLMAAVAFQCARAETIRSESSAVVDRARSAYRDAVDTSFALAELRAGLRSRRI